MCTPLADVNVPACGVCISDGWNEAVVRSALNGHTVAAAPTADTSCTVPENERPGLRAS
jgi:hypothetical protein